MSFAVRPNLAPPSAGGVVSLAGVPSLISDTVSSPSSAHVSTVLASDGYGEYDQLGGIGTFDWYTPNTPGIGSSYWARLDVNSGAAPDGTSPSTGVWHSLGGADLNWEWTRTTNGITSANVTLRIASDSGGSTVVANNTYDIEAERV